MLGYGPNPLNPEWPEKARITVQFVINYEEAGENANVILGCVIDNKLNDQVNITVIATGLNDDEYPAYFKRETEN